jgi:hypothetical protein
VRVITNEEIKHEIRSLENGYGMPIELNIDCLKELLEAKERNKQLEAEAKMGNIPYKETIKLKERNKKLEWFVKKISEYGDCFCTDKCQCLQCEAKQLIKERE